jgi:predicted transcriptional regulator YheO
MKLLRAETELMNKADEFLTPRQFFNFLLEKGLLNSKRVNMFAARTMYRNLLEKGYKKMDAITQTAETLCLSEDSVQEAIYRHKDI